MSQIEPNTLVQKATSILTKFIYFGDRIHDALELFERAANLYKMNKEWSEAGDTYLQIAECYEKQKELYSAGTAYKEAGNCFQRVNITRSIEAHNKGISLYLEMDKFPAAAEMCKNLAKTFEQEGNMNEAVQYYQKAADYYDGDNMRVQAYNCRTEMAHLLALLGSYEDAVEQFERIVSEYISGDRLLQYQGKILFMKSVLCSFAKLKNPDEYQIELIRGKIEEYSDIDVHFSRSHQCQLVTEIAEAFEKNYDVSMFQKALRQYDSISKLDAWMEKVLLKVMDVLKNGAENDMKDLLGYDDSDDLC